MFQDGLNILLGIAALVAILDYFGLKPKFYKGPIEPRLGDLSYTEMIILGL